MSELKNNEYRVEKSTTHILQKGVYVKVVSTDDNSVVLKTIEVGPYETKILRENFENYVESGHLVEVEYDSKMHD